jgi:hypothetical protein
MTGKQVFKKINDAMLERQRMSETAHLEKHHRPWIRPHDLKLLLADCQTAFDK